jgi:hypothetical protein
MGILKVCAVGADLGGRMELVDASERHRVVDVRRLEGVPLFELKQDGVRLLPFVFPQEHAVDPGRREWELVLENDPGIVHPDSVDGLSEGTKGVPPGGHLAGGGMLVEVIVESLLKDIGDLSGARVGDELTDSAVI